MNTAWQLPPPALLEDESALADALEEVYRGIRARQFRDAAVANHALPVQTRAPRRAGDWQLLLLLTPWMFARLLLPRSAPPLLLPGDWSAGARADAEPVVLGPAFDFTLLDTPQKGHLNFHPALGHYLIQPLVLAMESFTSADEVYAAWNEVIRTRDENMRRMQRDCPMQQEISRREFFSGLLRRTT